jgi:hypothetical protein
MGDSRGNSSRVFTREFKLAAVKELDSGKPAGYVARQLEDQTEPALSLGGGN